ncbi:MAG: prepilin peptidase [Rhodoluna sp.]
MEPFSFGEFFALAGPVYMLLISWPLSRIDIKQRRLPNRLVLPAFPIALIGELAASWLTNQWLKLFLALALSIGALIIGAFINRTAALGMGDVKLIAAIVLMLAWFSPIAALLALVFGFVAATAVVLFLLATGRSKLGSTIALGPYLLFGFAGSLAISVPSQMLG